MKITAGNNLMEEHLKVKEEDFFRELAALCAKHGVKQMGGSSMNYSGFATAQFDDYWVPFFIHPTKIRYSRGSPPYDWIDLDREAQP